MVGGPRGYTRKLARANRGFAADNAVAHWDARAEGLSMSRWLITNGARRVLSWSSWAVVGLGVFFAFMLTPWYRQIAAMPRVLLAVQWLGGALGVVAIPATLVLIVGMAIFCVREDRSRFSVKLSWFILFFLIAPFGSAIYYFFVYRKQVPATSGAGQ